MMQNAIKKISFFVLLSLSLCNLYAHSSFSEHGKDMLDVLGLKSSPALNEWTKFISSDMIDKTTFYTVLKQRHPGFKCKHRLFFHWGYNARPWNPFLEKKVVSYCEQHQRKNKHKSVNIADTISLFQREIQQEQKRRNALINSKTEKLFGFAHGGKDASSARFFASMAYNIHLIGDYTSDNTDLEGVQNINEVIGLIVIELRNLDKVKSASVIKEITNINKRYANPQKKADALLPYFKKSIPAFVKGAQSGSIYRRLAKRGFKFKV